MVSAVFVSIGRCLLLWVVQVAYITIRWNAASSLVYLHPFLLLDAIIPGLVIGLIECLAAVIARRSWPLAYLVLAIALLGPIPYVMIASVGPALNEFTIQVTLALVLLFVCAVLDVKSLRRKGYVRFIPFWPSKRP